MLFFQYIFRITLLFVVFVGLLGCTLEASLKEVGSSLTGTSPDNSVTIELTSPYIGPANISSYPASGTCKEEGAQVEVLKSTSVVLAMTTCSGGVWSVNLDLSAEPEGSLSFLARMTSPSGGAVSTTAVDIVKDTTAPGAISMGAVTDGTYSSSQTSPLLTWNAATDSGSGLDHYEVAIGTTAGSTDILTWTSIGNITSAQRTGLTLSEGTTYYPSVRAVDKAGNVSALVSGDGWIVDPAGPDVSGVVLNDGADTYDRNVTPTLTWNAAVDAASGVSHYELALGSTAGGTDVRSWTSVGNVATYQFTGLNLTRGLTYYASLRAYDNAGNVSVVIQGNGWVVNSETWVTNSAVKSILKVGDTVYLGGSFTSVSPWAGGGIPVSVTTGTVNWPNVNNKARVSGAVYAVINDLNGGYYIGGKFSAVGGIARENLAHILADGSVDLNFNPRTNNKVNALALSGDGGTLYVGGLFTTVNGGNSRNYVAAFSTLTGAVVAGFDSTIVYGVLNQVHALVLSADGNTLYIGGYFNTLNGGTTRNSIAAVATSSGTAVAGFDPNVSGSVYALALSADGGTLYLGGNFGVLNGGTTRNRIAAVATATGTAVAGFDPNVNNSVNALVLSPDGSTLYVGGEFTTINAGAITRNRIAAVSTSTGAGIAGFDPNASAAVKALALSADGGTLYLAGAFTTLNGGTAKKFIAGVTTSTGVAVAGFDPNPNSWIYTVVVSADGNSVYFGGYITTLDGAGVVRNRLAAIKTTGEVVAGFDPNVNGYVNSLQLSPDGNTLFLSGDFTTVNGGTARNYVAAVSTATGALVAGFNPNPNALVYTLELSPDGNTLYMGGIFTTLNGGTPRNYVAAVSAATGAAVAGFDPNANNWVFTLTLNADGSILYMGGSFTSVSATVRNRVAAVSTATGALVAGFDPNASGIVRALVLNSNESILYMGGSFNTLNAGTARNYVAAVSTSTGLLVDSFNPNLNSWVNTLGLGSDGTTLYIGGNFTTVNGGLTSGYSAAVTTSTGTAVAGFNANTSSTVNALTLSEDGKTLLLGGDFIGAGLGPAYYAPVNAATGLWAPLD